MQSRVISAIVLVAFVGAIGLNAAAIGQETKPLPAEPSISSGKMADFERLKQQVLRRCRDTGQADVLELAASVFGICLESASREEELLQSLVQSRNALLLRVHGLEQEISLLADDLGDLELERGELDKQARAQRVAFANAGPAPSEELIDKLEAVEAQIAKKKASQRRMMKDYYKLPQVAKVRMAVAELQARLASVAALRKQWAEEIDKAHDLREAALKVPQRIPLERLAASMKLEKPACIVTKHWMTRSGDKFNLFLIQMADGQVMGGALQPEPMQVYEVFGLVYGRNLSLKLLNKHNKDDSLTFTATAEVDPGTGKVARVRGTLKSDSGGAPDREWVFE